MALVTVLQVLIELVKRFGTMGGNGSSLNGCTRVGTRGGGGGLSCRCIPDNCHFFYTDKIFGAKNLHPNACKSG